MKPAGAANDLLRYSAIVSGLVLLSNNQTHATSITSCALPGCSHGHVRNRDLHNVLGNRSVP
jgi:hypothetical protein